MDEDREMVTVPRDFLESFWDSEPCSFDCNGNCQAHDFMLLPGELCPQFELKRLLGHE